MKTSHSSDPVFPEFKACLFKLVEELRRDVESGRYLLKPRFDPKTYRKYIAENSTCIEELFFTTMPELESLESYNELDSITSQQPQLVDQLNRTINFGNGSGLVGLHELIMAVIPRFFATRTQHVSQPQLSQTFDECYAKLESYLVSKTITVSIVWPLRRRS